MFGNKKIEKLEKNFLHLENKMFEFEEKLDHLKVMKEILLSCDFTKRIEIARFKDKFRKNEDRINKLEKKVLFLENENASLTKEFKKNKNGNKKTKEELLKEYTDTIEETNKLIKKLNEVK